MREIKFRGWNSKTGTMVDLHKITPLALSEPMNSQMAMQGMDGLFLPLKEDMPLMQFTGLKDKNGKEIYEGDILKVGPFCFPVHVDSHHGYRFMLGKDQICMTDARHGEIIGNIYENPELVKP